jgi:hypothetical protein
MGNIFEKFGELKGAKFVNIKGYTNKNGEISDQLINANISVENAKKRDLEVLKNFDVATLEVENIELAKTALTELINSAEKNLSQENRTTQSLAQSDAYISLGKGLKLNKETREVHVTGFVESKTVLVEGVYPETNKREKTIIKEAIKRTANLRMNKYRSYILKEVADMAISGDTVQIKR